MFKWLFVLLLFWFLYFIREVFPPFIVGAIIAYLLLPLVNQVSTTFRIRPGLAVGIIYIGALALIVGASTWFGQSIMEQFSALAAQRKDIITSLVQQISDGFHWQLDVEKTAEELTSSIEQNVGSPEEIVHLGGLLSKSLLSVLVCIVSSIYLLIDSRSVGQFCLRFIPEEKHEAVKKLSSQVNVMLSKYVRGQIFLVVLMSGVAYGILHFWLNIKYAGPIAILSGFLEIIPVLGPFFAITIATIVGVSQQGVHVAVFIILGYWIARLVEDYVVVPRFIGHAVELHPLAIIFAVLCGEVMAGALGMLIAIPVAASIKEILDFFYPPAGKEGYHAFMREKEAAAVVESAPAADKPEA
ncbi:MAG: AI-2E family transporter [Candidatus Obscuribacter sp.]|nr:AI-2E family transporter [Candidatus Melainabacteria bacterium]MDX1985138.1 AI-2E family transporter [Candidatus Obscuribacter sp.]